MSYFSTTKEDLLAKIPDAAQSHAIGANQYHSEVNAKMKFGPGKDSGLPDEPMDSLLDGNNTWFHEGQWRDIKSEYTRNGIPSTETGAYSIKFSQLSQDGLSVEGKPIDKNEAIKMEMQKERLSFETLDRLTNEDKYNQMVKNGKIERL